MPYPGYWQQDVHYTIDAEILDSLNIIDGQLSLQYWNNSPDTLEYVYFHLYQNAFQPKSYMESLYKNNNKKVTFGPHEKDGLGTVTESIQANGTDLKSELDNTILKVFLNEPLLPGTDITFTMDFKTYFDEGGSLRRRMKTYWTGRFKHFDGVHWYPSMAVYDHKFGWTTEQHLDKEFYADFGTFDVSLTFPSPYFMEATGTLQNFDEIYPNGLRDSIDLSKFKKPRAEISTPVASDGSKKTWRYHAENVHNFAFTADPLYRSGEVEWNGIKIVAIVQEQHAPRWQESAEFTKKVIETYSTDFGTYAWPKIVIADANDGMEYPMLTLDGGSYPGHQGLIAHEVGHMWYYGMLGSNETYRAYMDEGFTQFLTAWSLDKINGDFIDYKDLIRDSSKNKYQLNHLNPKRNRYEKLYYPYLKYVHMGYDLPLNTHSSGFNGAVRHGGGYGLVYFKTGVMLYNLRYVLGEELFSKAMKHYFDTWKMCHPYPEDFRQTIISFTKVDLNWFFDQWLETTKYIDYSVDKVEGAGNDEYEITFSRLGRMHMPIDFIAINKNNDTLSFHIPNTWFIKKTEAEVLPKWYGWDNIQPTYTARITVPGKLKNVIIDPEFMLADINMRDNRWSGSYKLKLDHKVRDYPNWFESENFHRPDVWYNHYDGLQLGWHIEGNYFKQTSFYSATAWFNSGLGQQTPNGFSANAHRNFSFELYSKESLMNVWRNLYLVEHVSFNAGLAKAGFGLEKTFRRQDPRQPEYTKIAYSLDFMQRPDSSDLGYSIYPDHWSTTLFNNTANLSLERKYVYEKGSGLIESTLRSPGIFSDFNYSYLDMSVTNDNKLGKLDIRTRWYGRLGFGNAPSESALYRAGANPEELYNNKYTRAAGFAPVGNIPFGSDLGNFQGGGGLNLRGYAGYLSPDGNSVTDSLTYIGRSGSSVSVEIDFDKYIHFQPKTYRKFFHLDLYAFTDGGFIVYDNALGNEAVGKLRFDAGLGSMLTIKFGNLDITPLRIRFDMPLFLSRPPASDSEFIDFRYVLGINRSF